MKRTGTLTPDWPQPDTDLSENHGRASLKRQETAFAWNFVKTLERLRVAAAAAAAAASSSQEALGGGAGRMEGRAGRPEEVGSRALKEGSQVERNGDTVLENQEALQMILMNQETLKDLMVKLLKTISTIEEKVQAMGREIGTLSQFTQELNQVGDENNWA